MYRFALPSRRIAYAFAQPVCTTASSPCCSARWQRSRYALTRAASVTTIRQYSYSSQDRRALPFPALEDTIYALSTAQGKAGIAVIRISGPSCLDVYKSFCPGKVTPRPRYATLRTLYHPRPDGALSVVLDSDALVLYFPAPATVTGENVLELHVHGGSATVKAVLAAIPHCPISSSSLPSSSSSSSSCGIIRYAEPGEFTKRAFLHDRLDLAQVESLSDTLAAETEQQRRAAVRGGAGALGQTYERWRQQLLSARGELEALIDFSEDQHFDEAPADLLAGVRVQVADMLHGIRLHERGSQRSELLRRGIGIALVGPPNAGKSSLMNLVVGREASIVSAEAGTTRDVIEARLDIRGYLCSFADTAGFRGEQRRSRHSDGGVSLVGEVEEEGIRRARQKAREADVVIALASVERSEDQATGGLHIRYDEQTLNLAADADAGMLVVNKSDVADPPTLQKLLSGLAQNLRDRGAKHGRLAIHTVSCKEAASRTMAETPNMAGQEWKSRHAHSSSSSSSLSNPGGIHALVDALGLRLAAMTAMPPDLEDLLGVTERQRQLLVDCRHHLEDFMAVAGGRGSKEEIELGRSRSRSRDEEGKGQDSAEVDCVLAAEFLRYAADCLARITGRGEAGDVEDVLGVVFEKFCVGK